MKRDSSWHEKLYDELYAKTGLDSKAMHVRAKDEVDFLISKLHLKEGMTILDIPCGTGRHAKFLGKLGIKVTGVDINSACLKFAKKNCTNKNILLKRGDMKDLSWARNHFDVTINMFTSFGYFPTDKENEQVMRSLVGTVKKNGALVIQNINRDWLLKIFDPARWGHEENHFWLESTKYDPKTKYVECQRIMIENRGHRAHQSYHRIRLYSVNEMTKLMKKCGLKQVQVFGSPGGEPVDKACSTHPIYIGYK